jgi:large subunit ribosomal protein L16
MLMPKRVKYRRQHRGKMRGRAKGGTEVNFGEFGLASSKLHLGLQTVKLKQHVLQ